MTELPKAGDRLLHLLATEHTGGRWQIEELPAVSFLHKEPRVFHNALAARAFLSSWLRGTFKNTALYGDDGPDVKCTPQPHRKKDDMEIVEFECIESPSTIWNEALEQVGIASRVCEIKADEPVLTTLDRLLKGLQR
jgi:hypothetical protein